MLSLVVRGLQASRPSFGGRALDENQPGTPGARLSHRPINHIGQEQQHHRHTAGQLADGAGQQAVGRTREQMQTMRHERIVVDLLARRRAQLQQAWSAYRETEDRYRSTVLAAFREVENNLSLTDRLTVASDRQDAAVSATLKTQNLTTELYQGGLASSLELIYAQVATLQARIESVQLKAELLRASVGLIRALGGGWNRSQLPGDEEIQPFQTFQYTGLDKPPAAGGIDVNLDRRAHKDLTRPSGR